MAEAWGQGRPWWEGVPRPASSWREAGPLTDTAPRLSPETLLPGELPPGRRLRSPSPVPTRRARRCAGAPGCLACASRPGGGAGGAGAVAAKAGAVGDPT